MNTWKPWIGAVRPKTLAAGIFPVLIGTCAAYSNDKINIIVAVVAAICSALIQILSNFFNEIYDFRKGADTKERLGPTRMVAAGIISEKQMLSATAAVSLVAIILGLYLSYNTGWEIFGVGIISLSMAWAYTGGPYPLAYKGLGEIFVLLFFGIVAVNGSYYLQTMELKTFVVVLSCIPGLLSANLLSINNIRDIESDVKANKLTLAVRFGDKHGRRIIAFQTVLAYALILALAIASGYWWISLPIATLPLGIALIRNVMSKQGRDLNRTLAQSAILLSLISILLCIGLLMK